MISSMTAFAQTQSESKIGTLTWEIRSVNHRYLETTFRLPELARAIEQELRNEIKSKLARGKVECILKLENDSQQTNTLNLNESVLNELNGASNHIAANIENVSPLRIIDVLKWPGVIAPNQIDAQSVHAEILNSFNKSLESILQARGREGCELSKLLKVRLEKILNNIQTVKTIMPGLLNEQQLKLKEKLKDLDIAVNADRMEQEITLLLQKADIEEEIDRLSTHVQEVNRILDTGGVVGRRLDFLMQELNREANTLGAKSINAELSQISVELKVLIEQMREQIQNIE